MICVALQQSVGNLETRHGSGGLINRLGTLKRARTHAKSSLEQLITSSTVLFSPSSGAKLLDFSVLWFQTDLCHCVFVWDCLISLCSGFKMFDFTVMVSDV